jgi:ATP-dependent Clp protease ATP-binding subunit ClpA
MVGPYCEVYLREVQGELVTEIQLPVERDLRLDRLRVLVPEIPHETLVTASERLRQARQFALDEARDFGQPQVGPEHLLLGLLRAWESLAEHVLRRQGVVAVALREAVERLNGVGAEPASEPQFGEEVRRALLAAVEQRNGLGQDYLGTEHVLLALLHKADAPAILALTHIGVDTHHVLDQVLTMLNT